MIKSSKLATLVLPSQPYEVPWLKSGVWCRQASASASARWSSVSARAIVKLKLQVIQAEHAFDRLSKAKRKGSRVNKILCISKTFPLSLLVAFVCAVSGKYSRIVLQGQRGWGLAGRFFETEGSGIPYFSAVIGFFSKFIELPSVIVVVVDSLVWVQRVITSAEYRIYFIFLRGY